jgi:DNA polymerase-1
MATSKRSRHLLIDGDVLVYRFAHGSQILVKWTRDLWATYGLEDPAKLHVSEFITELREQLEADIVTVVLSDLDGNFRHQFVDAEYKANRAGVVRPILFTVLRAFLFEEYAAVMEPDLEGDDLLGLLATQPSNDEFIICTIDKDLLTVPGLHFNWDKAEPGDDGTLQPTCVDDAEAYYNHMTQTLTGDATDGYKGVPGVGPVKAAKLLEPLPLERMWDEGVVPAFEKAGLSEEVALMNARCARVLRGDDYDFKTKTVRLWEPGL